MPQFDDTLQNSKLEELHHREEETLLQNFATQHGLQYIDLHDVTIDVDALRMFSEAESREHEFAVFKQGKNTVSIAARNPESPKLKEVLQKIKDQECEPIVFLASTYSLEHVWERYKDAVTTVASRSGVLDVDPEEIKIFSEEIASHLDVAEKMLVIRNENGARRISKTIELIFGGALALGASDVHIEPEAKTIRIRYRIDGVLWDVVDVESHIYKLLISRLKLISGLKLNIHSEAQDGRFTFDVGSREVEVRSSVIPGAFGESMVMRLLDPDASGFSLDSLDLNQKLRTVMEEELSRPNGAIITTGPTGSGKTTALYAFLQSVHTPEIKIITIEDPVEYKLPGIVQTQVEDDYTFASGLRAVLRQDPDVIMVGEIRDREVAETAVHASLTGHLVFSTLHTNSAVGAFPRLIDLGVDSRMIGSAFNIVLGQRLTRRLCDDCKVERDMTTEEQKIIARIMDQPVAIHSIFEAPGCEKCGGKGYKGRIGIYEAIKVDKAVEEAIIRDPRESNILEAARPQGIPSMQQDGVMKVLAGITTIDELSRVIDLYGKNDTSQVESEKDINLDEHVV